MFTELHARSAFSFHRGATQPEELVERAAELALPAIAITDRDGVYGSARAHATAARARGTGATTRAITGAEITLEDGTALPLLVATRAGYQNLCRMLTRAKLRAPKNESRVTYAELEEFVSEAGQGGLIGLSGDEEGPVRHHLENRDLEQTHQKLTRLKDILGSENLYVELQRHYARGEDLDQPPPTRTRRNREAPDHRQQRHGLRPAARAPALRCLHLPAPPHPAG